MAEKKKEVVITPPTRAEMDATVIRRVFKGNNALLIAMRAVMLGLGANDSQKKMVKEAFSDPELFAIFSHRCLPTIRKDEEIGNIQGMWRGAEKMVFGYSRDTIKQAILYKQEGILRVAQALNLLLNPDGVAPATSPVLDIKKDPLGIDLLVCNQFVGAIEDQLVALKIVAATKEVTAEERRKQAEEDSLE